MASLMLALTHVSAWETDPSYNNQATPPDMDLYAYSVKMNANGTIFVYFQTPTYGGQTMRLQIFDKDGNATLGDEGMIVSNEPNISWTKVNDLLMTDHDGNAIISVLDCRKGLNQETYTIYKIDEKGNVIWNTTLNNGEVNGEHACMSMACTTDGGYVFAYYTFGVSEEGSNVGFINMEKLDKDGKTVWTNTIFDKNANISYPYLFDAGFNQTILAYTRGASNTLTVRLIDFDGSPVWGEGEDVVVYRDGYGSIPALQVFFNFQPAPDNDGIFLAWHNPDNAGQGYENRFAWVKNDGTFAFSTGEGGTNVSNDTENTRQVPQYFYDSDEKAIYLVFRVFNQSYQSYEGIYMQKMTLDGELLWGPNGKPVIEIQDAGQYHNPSIQDAGDGKFAIFYQHMDGQGGSGAVENVMIIYDKDGNIIQDPVNFATSEETKNDLETTPLLNGDHYIAWWTEGGLSISEKTHLMMQYVNVDGTTVPAGIFEVSKVKTQPSMVFGANGQRLPTLQKGLNIVRTPDGQSIKRMVK